MAFCALPASFSYFAMERLCEQKKWKIIISFSVFLQISYQKHENEKFYCII